jgi:SAM-dependent methyltransferase
MGIEAGRAYSRRAVEYIERLGTMAAVHPSDRQLVDSWANTVGGPVIDAGCGPGQWTNHLVERGVVASGVDLSPEFIDHARSRYAGVSFEVGDLDDLGAADESVGGVLAWYSLIHHDPRTIHVPLDEFSRVLRPGGGLLLGFFVGSAIEAFDHAVVGAYRWPVLALSEQLDAAGFDVIEAHTRTVSSAGARPHGAIVAQRRPSAHASRSTSTSSTTAGR